MESLRHKSVRKISAYAFGSNRSYREHLGSALAMHRRCLVSRCLGYLHAATLSGLVTFRYDAPKTSSLAMTTSYTRRDVPEVAAAWSFTACRSRLKALS